MNSDLQTLLERGQLAQRQGRLAEAEQWLRQAAAAAPRQPQPWFSLGDVLEDMQRWPEAEACYARTAALAPQVAVVQYRHACVLRQVGQPVEALAAIRRALAIDAVAPDALQLKAMLEEEFGALALYELARLRWALGEADFTAELDAAAPQSPAASGIKAQLLLKAERPVGAAEAFRRALRGLPAASGYHDGLGLALSALGEHVSAPAAHAQAMARRRAATCLTRATRWSSGSNPGSLTPSRATSPNCPRMPATRCSGGAVRAGISPTAGPRA